LRLSDVEALRLDSEPAETSGDWSARAATLALTAQVQGKSASFVVAASSSMRCPLMCFSGLAVADIARKALHEESTS